MKRMRGKMRRRRRRRVWWWRNKKLVLRMGMWIWQYYLCSRLTRRMGDHTDAVVVVQSLSFSLPVQQESEAPLL